MVNKFKNNSSIESINVIVLMLVMSVRVVVVHCQFSSKRRLSERRSGERTLEADGTQLLRRVEGGEQTGAVTETEKRDRQS
jgi:hypothetical protein